MKRGILRTISVLAALMLSPVVALADDQSPCSLDSAAGTWGHTFTGAIIPIPPSSTQALPTAGVGTTTFDAAGNVSGTQHASRNGAVDEETFSGKLQLSPESPHCTGTLTIDLFNPSGTKFSTLDWAVVLDDNASEFRAIVTNVTLQPSGTSVPTVTTLEAKRLFSDAQNQQ
jgi:hypothetical protein